MKKLIGLVVLVLGLAVNAGAQNCVLTSNITSGFVGVSGYGLVDKSVVTQNEGNGITLDSHQQLVARYGLASHRVPNGDTADHNIYGAIIKFDPLGAGGLEYDTFGSSGLATGITYRQFGLVQTPGGLMLQYNYWYPHYLSHHTPPLFWIYAQAYNQPYTVGTSPKYGRMIRTGTTLNADTSPDGVNWTTVVSGSLGSASTVNEDIGVFTWGQDNSVNDHVLQLENVNIDGQGTAINYDERVLDDGSLAPSPYDGGAIQEVQAGGNVGLLANPVGVGNQQSYVQLSPDTCKFDASFVIKDSFAATGGGGTVFPATSQCIGLNKCFLSWSNPLNYPNGGEYFITVPSSGIFNIEHIWTFTGDNFTALTAGDQKFDITIKTQ